MSKPATAGNRVRQRRLDRDWSQAELAGRAGLSRAAVSAIEVDRLIPSVAAALKLAQTLECTVEELFGTISPAPTDAWSWSEDRRGRYWRAEISGQVLSYPVEATPIGEIPHDGVFQGSRDVHRPDARPADTLVVATCDPAAGLLATEYRRRTGFRMIVFGRSSRAAMELLKNRRVHVAAVHLATAGAQAGNARFLTDAVCEPASLLRLARWEEGIALKPTLPIASVENATRSRLAWIGREDGSGARACLEELLGPRRRLAGIARDHRSVAAAVREGWGDAGVCVRIASEEVGLRFLPVRQEDLDLAFLKDHEHDPRIRALVEVMRSATFRRMLGELPGYDVRLTGELQHVPVKARQQDAGPRNRPQGKG